MTIENDRLRTPQKRASGLGSAKYGAEHWWQQRVTAIALIFISLYMVTLFFWQVVFVGGYEGAATFFASPDRATLGILFIAVAFHHAVLGIQVVIEDYVHSEGLKIASILAVKFIAYTLAVIAILSIAKILLWATLSAQVQGGS